MSLDGFHVVPGTPEHIPAVKKFLTDSFRVTEPITCALACSEDDVDAFFNDITDGSLLEGQHSLLVYDNDVIAAVCLNNIKELDNSENLTPPTFDPQRDYFEDIEAGPYKPRNANRLCTFVSTLEQDLQYLSGGSTRIFKIDVLCVNSNYQGKGIGRWLVEQSLKRAAEAHCTFVASAATAQASQAIFNKFGLKVLRELPFSCFREAGEVVFKNLRDGGLSGKLMGMAIETAMEDEDLR